MERGLKNAARVVVVCSKKYVERANAGHTGHLTREGLASALNEIAAAGVDMRVQGRTVPVREIVHGACEILGPDPLYVASEGRFAIVHWNTPVRLLMSCSSCLFPSRPPASV